jgi:hypothetical protein
MGKKIRINKKKVVRVYVECNGNLGKTAVALGIERTTLWRMQQADPELAQLMEDNLQAHLDNIEQAAICMAEGIPKMEWVETRDAEGNATGKVYMQTGWVHPPDARFAKLVLDARAKARGYGKQEIDLGNVEGTQLLITNTVVRRGEVSEGKVEVLPD